MPHYRTFGLNGLWFKSLWRNLRFGGKPFLLSIYLVGGCNLLILGCSQSPPAIDVIEEEEPFIAKGCANAEYPDWKSSPYVLPYPVGLTYSIDLSNCSGSFHGTGRPDEYAIDFNMEIGTRVTTSREGTVYNIEERYTDAGEGVGNFVIIDHGDNTYGVYLHFTQNGVAVELGQEVDKGDFLGLSGSSGLAGYPHLHLVVVEGDPAWPYRSIPVTFSNTVPNSRSLASGYAYPARPYR